MKQLHYKLIGILFSFVSWVFGIILAKRRSWRIWEFDNKVVPVVFIGLWDAFYFQIINISGSVTDVQVHSTLNSNWTISSEIEYGRTLILLAIMIKSTVLLFSSIAFWFSRTQDPNQYFIQSCYNISAFFLFVSSVFTVSSVTWNFAMDFSGQTTLDFPRNFPVGKEMLKKKRCTYVFPLGIITATLSVLSASLFM